MRFFPETGHSLSFGFKAFWEHNGGLAVFGYPLTDEFQEQSADDARLEAYARLLYDEAVITEGSKVRDPLAFAKRVNELLLKDVTGK